MTIVGKFVRGLFLCFAIAPLASANASAGYVNDSKGWLALTPETKAGYVQGMNDSLNYIFVDDTLVDAVAKKGRIECLVVMKTSSSLLADRITMAYREPRFATLAPTAIYIIKMGEVCRSYINQERAKFGLGPN